MRCAICEFLRRYLLTPLCRQLLFNSDMSREIDRLTVENERLWAIVRGGDE
jgi:hypothetical protein